MAHASALAATRVVADDLEAQRRDRLAGEAARDAAAGARLPRLGSTTGGLSGFDNHAAMIGEQEYTGLPAHRNDVMRLRLYSLGEHIRSSDVSTGTLVNISSTLSWDAMKAILLNELYGESITIAKINLRDVSLHLLPDGEKINSPGESARCFALPDRSPFLLRQARAAITVRRQPVHLALPRAGGGTSARRRVPGGK